MHYNFIVEAHSNSTFLPNIINRCSTLTETEFIRKRIESSNLYRDIRIKDIKQNKIIYYKILTNNETLHKYSDE